MKIVKTNGRWKMYQYGFKVALRFDRWSEKARAYERWLNENRGSGWGDQGQWCSQFGHARTADQPRPYMIGLKNENDVSIILLAVSV